MRTSDQPEVLRAVRVGCAILLLGSAASPSWASTLFLGSAAATLGQSANLCITLEGGENRIAGLQTNLVWDDSCMTPANASRLCRANAASGKSVQSALQGRGVLKAILISFSDVNPIPDGPLFCCEFIAVGNEGSRCAPVRMENILGSTATGTRISDIRAGNTGVFSILGGYGGPAPVATFVPVPVPTSQGSNSQLGGGGDGCTIVPERGAPARVWVIASVAFLLFLVQQRRVAAGDRVHATRC